MTAKHCGICVHSQRAAIEHDLLIGVQLRIVGEAYGVSVAHLRGHLHDHMARSQQQPQRRRKRQTH
jgi:hypothetical protein